jgi:hypothetical protein
MEEQVQVENPETNQRPVFLTVLCILTFIGSGLALLFALLGLIAAGAIDSMMSSFPMPTGASAGPLKSIILLILYGASLYGAILMWQLKRIGFYLYTVAQVIILILGFGVLSLIFTAAFIIMYGVNLKYME